MQNTNPIQNSTNKRNMIISGVVVLVVLGALFVGPKLNNVADKKDAGEKPQEVAEVITTDTPAPLTRADATQKYAGNIIRFSGDCQADQSEITATENTTIMIDNATDARRTITVGAKSYSVGSERYTLSWLNTGAGELSVTCDGKEVSKVVVQ